MNILDNRSIWNIVLNQCTCYKSGYSNLKTFPRQFFENLSAVVLTITLDGGQVPVGTQAVLAACSGEQNQMIQRGIGSLANEAGYLDSDKANVATGTLRSTAKFLRCSLMRSIS